MRWATLSVAVLLSFASNAHADAAQPDVKVLASEPLRVLGVRHAVARLAWLAGCWQRTTPRRVVDEQWMKPSAGLMLGIGRTTNAAGDTLVEYEQTKIEQRGTDLVFTAKPSGQAMDSFTAIDVSDSSVVFENKAHDFPQRVGYRLRADGTLAAFIEGTQDGKTRHVDFPYARVRCP
jgi:hypothetical protein